MIKRTVAAAFLVAFAVAAYAGAPLKGIDVKLGKNQRTTDANGKVDFGVLPAGSYEMTLRLAGDAGGAEVEVTGAAGGTIRRQWDFKTARAAGEPHINVNSDGKHPLQATVVRSKSNISNN